MKLELTQRLRQEQILAPQMILSMDILLLTNTELEARLQDEFISNPALEIAEPQHEAEAEASHPAPSGDASDLARTQAEVFSQLETFQNLPSLSYESRRSRSSGDGDDKLEALANAPGKPDGLPEHLIQQIHLLDVPRPLADAAEFIVHNLDSRGYLLFPPEEIAKSLEPEVSPEEFRKALEVVRGLDPAGVGARDLQECLILQLSRDHQDYALEMQIINHHLEDLRQNKLPKIARDLGRTVEQIKDAVDLIGALDPFPGNAYDHEPVRHIRPEVVVEKVEGRLEVRVEDGSLPEIRISESCRQLLKESRGNPEVLSFLRKKIESAQWLVQAVRQRQRTIHDIARTLVEYQADFMEHGVEHIKAMKMQTIADLVGVHISTISRAIKGKYMQTPWGTFEMRYFFTGGVERTDGVMESRRNIYREISALIESEDKRKPLSDTALTRLLRQRGLDIARRTVTKYREQEKIPPSRMRKEY
jgi:RNA polymerase sigma-54 factor